MPKKNNMEHGGLKYIKILNPIFINQFLSITQVKNYFIKLEGKMVLNARIS